MKVTKRIVLAVACAVLALSAPPALAQSKGLPITAEQAFDAVQMHKDPATGAIREDKTFLLVDIRTRAEVWWIGAAARVTEILLANGETITPDYGKVILEHDGMFITYEVAGRKKRTLVQHVQKMTNEPIGYNIPSSFWDEANRSMIPNSEFQSQIAALAGDTKPVLILFCRSGDRSNTVITNAALFEAVYEIDAPENGVGGFEGNVYNTVHNGYRGFPGRDTLSQAVPSVSWKDAGLPIRIGKFPPFGR